MTTRDKRGDRMSRQENSELQVLQTKCDQIVDESLESTRRMADLVDRAKEAGIRSLVLIDEQGEQLERIEDGMNQISVDMEDAEKNLEGLEQCCGLCILPWKRSKKFRRGGEYERTLRTSEDGKVNSPIHRIAMGRNAQSKGPIITRLTNDVREDEMEENLQCVSGILGNLRNMAIDMGSEIEYQNRQIDRINYKTKSNESRILMANQELKKSLRKINNI